MSATSCAASMSESGSSLTTFFRIKNNEIYMVLFKSFAPYAPDARLEAWRLDLTLSPHPP